MRIGIDIRALMEGKTTGVEVYVTNLLHALFKLDTVNQYVLFANNARPVKLPEFRYPNVETRLTRYPNKFFNLCQKFLRWPKVNRLLGGVDLFFSPHWRVVALDSDVPLVVTFHDLSFEVMPSFFSRWQRIWHKFMNYREAARRAVRVIAVSESTRRDLLELYGVPEEKIRVIHSGVRLSEVVQPVADLPEQYFLALGTFEPRKNLTSVLAAYGEYCRQSRVSRRLVLAGSRGWNVHLLIPDGLRDKIFVIQDVTDAQKTYLYKRAFALLFLSFYEGFGFPILEAAKSGVPVIASFATSLPEIGADFMISVNPFRSSQVTECMLDLEEEPEYYSSLRARGAAGAENFTWDKTAAAVLALFQEVKK